MYDLRRLVLRRQQRRRKQDAHKHRKVVVRKVVKSTTAMPSARQVRSVKGSPEGETIAILARGVSAPPVGVTLVIPPSAKAPDGVLGIVVARRNLGSGAVRLVTRPGTLDSAYKSFHAHLEGSLGQLVEGDEAEARAQSSSALGRFAPTFHCTGPGLGHPITTMVDLSQLHVTLDVTSSPSILFLLTGTPRFGLNFDFTGRVTCEAAAKAPIPIAGTGLALDIGPRFSFKAGGKVGAHFTWAPRIAYAFFRSRSSGNFDKHVFVNQGGVDFTGGADVTLGLALDTEISLAGRAGVEGTIGPQITGGLNASSSSATSCFDVDGEVAADLEAHADVFFRTWTFHIGSFRFGHTRLMHRCADDGGGGHGVPPGPGGPTSGTFDHVTPLGPLSGPAGFGLAVGMPACSSYLRVFSGSWSYIEGRQAGAPQALGTAVTGLPGMEALSIGTHQLSFACQDISGTTISWSDPGFEVDVTGSAIPTVLQSGTVTPGEDLVFESGPSASSRPCPSLPGVHPALVALALEREGGTGLAASRSVSLPDGQGTESLAVPPAAVPGEYMAWAECVYSPSQSEPQGYQGIFFYAAEPVTVN